MPKNDFKGDKKKKIKLSPMSQRERDKISDVKQRLEVAKKQEKSRGRIITAEQLAAEEASKKSENRPKISVKVRPKVGSTQETKPSGIKIREQYKDKFGKKMTKQEVQDKYFKRTLDPLREQLNVLVQEANQRYIEQRELGIHSRAALEAERTLNKNGKAYFTATFLPFNSDLHSRKEINREFSRVMNFLSDYTSTIEGGEIEKLQNENFFGAQWRKQGMAGYDEAHVKKVDADLTFKIYHELLESQGGWQRLIGYFKAVNPGVIEYGSENLINAIYDMVKHKDSMYVPEDMDIEGVILARANDIVNSMIDSYMRLSVLQRSGKDYGSFEDPEDAERRRQIYEWGLKRDEYKEEFRKWRNS